MLTPRRSPDAWDRSVGGGRAIGLGVRGGSIGQLHDRGWDVDDLGLDELYPVRDFDSLSAAIAQADADLPAGTPVSWRDAGDRLGGFVTGFPAVGPGVSGELPVLVIWPEPPAGVELLVNSWSDLKRVLLERMDRLVERFRTATSSEALRALPRVSDEQLEAGRQRALDALERLETERRLIPGIGGPVEDVRCSAELRPVHGLRWDGFADGWRGDELALAGGGHPILSCDVMLPDYDGEGNRIYREGVQEGVAARRAAGFRTG